MKHRCRSVFVKAFSLLELLVALAVAALLVGMIMHLTSQSLRVAVGTEDKISARREALTALGRIREDLLRMPGRDDMDYHFQINPGGSDRMVFPTEVTGIGAGTSASGLSIVEYALDDNEGLTRAVASVDWEDVEFSGTESGSMNSTQDDPDTGKRLAIAPGALVCKILFRNREGDLTDQLPERRSDLAGVVVAIAVIDPKSRRALGEAEITNLRNVFRQTASAQALAGGGWGAVWREALDNQSTLRGASAVEIKEQTVNFPGR